MITKEKINKLHLKQIAYDELQSQMALKRQEFDEDNKELQDELAMTFASINDLKHELEAEALDEFEETSSKQLTGGLGIRISKTFVYDEETALSWSKEHKVCLSLDKVAFKKTAIANGLEFVVVTENPKVTFPSKLVLE